MKDVYIDWPDELGHYLRQARLRRELGLGELAARIERSEDWLSRLEWGEERVVPTQSLARLVAELELDPIEVDGLTGSLIRDVRPGFRSYLLPRRVDRWKAALGFGLQRARLAVGRARDRIYCGLSLTGALA